jgi:DNA-3-methyladenine glycosylase
VAVAGVAAREAARTPDSPDPVADVWRPPWRVGVPFATSFPPGFLHRPVTRVARELLGTRLVSTVGGTRTVGVLVECEAYEGRDDPASHAATRTGATRRNQAMFGPAGRAYVYRIYGMHWCLNVVTGHRDDPQAVLLRGLEPLEGEDEMGRRRHGRTPLAAGPGRLCEALGVDGALYGHDLSVPPLVLAPGWRVPDAVVEVSGRVGVRAAAERPYRFYVRGSPGVTR